MNDHDLKVIALLGILYPDWRFGVADAPGLPRWWAHRDRPVTTAQQAAGARTSIGRATPQRLATALGHYGEIIGRVRQR
ncbi:hypothetical protein [Streptosporangium sp. NPDC051022]|uniref:hypothetical protein n=1 Tax=Streptosporangium sp. NPDC051022 TaxID=3155752 RepID=UPI003434B316